MLHATEKLSYRINEAAQASGLSRARIYELINEGRLETVKIGHVQLISAASLRALVAPDRAPAEAAV
jgi:excisionase family DNA binding protein